MTSDEIITLIEERYYECPNVEKGRCETWWRHDDCVVLAYILHKITGNDKYDQHRHGDFTPLDNIDDNRVE